jgi:hypothetical protein
MNIKHAVGDRESGSSHTRRLASNKHEKGEPVPKGKVALKSRISGQSKGQRTAEAKGAPEDVSVNKPSSKAKKSGEVGEGLGRTTGEVSLLCSNCGETGHIAIHCGRAPVCKGCGGAHTTAMCSKYRSERLCYYCQGTGHIANKCPQKRQPGVDGEESKEPQAPVDPTHVYNTEDVHVCAIGCECKINEHSHPIKMPISGAQKRIAEKQKAASNPPRQKRECYIMCTIGAACDCAFERITTGGKHAHLKRERVIELPIELDVDSIVSQIEIDEPDPVKVEKLVEPVVEIPRVVEVDVRAERQDVAIGDKEKALELPLRRETQLLNKSPNVLPFVIVDNTDNKIPQVAPDFGDHGCMVESKTHEFTYALCASCGSPSKDHCLHNMCRPSCRECNPEQLKSAQQAYGMIAAAEDGKNDWWSRGIKLDTWFTNLKDTARTGPATDVVTIYLDGLVVRGGLLYRFNEKLMTLLGHLPGLRVDESFSVNEGSSDYASSEVYNVKNNKSKKLRFSFLSKNRGISLTRQSENRNLMSKYKLTMEVRIFPELFEQLVCDKNMLTRKVLDGDGIILESLARASYSSLKEYKGYDKWIKQPRVLAHTIIYYMNQSEGNAALISDVRRTFDKDFRGQVTSQSTSAVAKRS